MLCGSCGSENPDGRSFCGQCGVPVEISCSTCGARNRVGQKFCSSCGKSLGGQPTSPSTPVTGGASRPIPASIANGRYLVRRMLGEGASKIVYLAHDQTLDRDVAIALFKVEGLDEAGRARILREARAMGRLGDHVHIVGIYDIGQAEQGQPYIVSQYVAGGSLGDLLRRSPAHRLPISEAIRIAEGLCRGIEYAHSLGIIHRDIKPANIFLTADGTPLLGDFGLAIAPDQSRITSHGMLVGTAAYLPPEQALGNSLEPRSDLYSFGAMLYELLTGRPPFIGNDLMAIVSQHVNASPEPPSKYTSEVSPALDALVLRLLAKTPAERPLSATMVTETLHTIGASTRGVMDDLASSVMVERPSLQGHTAADGTVSIMFSDIENSTAMIERLGDLRAREIFREHNRTIREQVARQRGYEVKSMGDGFMVAFTSARRAVLCAMAIQRALADHTARHPDLPLRVRIGLNTGEAIRESGDFFGKTVVLAARIGAAAHGGEILVSSTFKEVSHGAGDIPYDVGQEMTLKGLAGTHRVYRVLWSKGEETCGICSSTIPANSDGCPNCKGRVVELPPSRAVPAARAPELPREWTQGTTAKAQRLTGEFEAVPGSNLHAPAWRVDALRTLVARNPRMAGAAVVVILFTCAFAITRFEMRRTTEQSMGVASPNSPVEKLPVKAVPARVSESRHAAAVRSLPSLAGRTHASERAKVAAGAIDSHETVSSLPKSKTTMISSSISSTAGESEGDDAVEGQSAVTQCAPTPHRYNIQVDAVSEKSAADEIVHRISTLGFNACEKTLVTNGQRQYAVRIGPYDSADQAAAAQEKLHEQYKASFSEPPS